MRPIPYFYQKGQITSSKRLSRSNHHTPTLLREKLLEIKDFEERFKDYDIYYAGSLAVGYGNPKDIDVLVTGSFENNYEIFELMNIISNVGINLLQTFTDVFFIKDISILDLTVIRGYTTEYECYTNYSIELEIVDNEITTFRDFSNYEKVGLLTKHTLLYPSKKQIDRGYVGKKYKKLI